MAARIGALEGDHLMLLDDVHDELFLRGKVLLRTVRTHVADWLVHGGGSLLLSKHDEDDRDGEDDDDDKVIKCEEVTRIE